MKLLCDLTVTSRPLRPRTGLPQPALRMDFVNGTYHPGGFGSAITFARAGAARYFDASGVMQVAAADTPRIDHHPLTLARRGLLIEGARTNLVLNSGASAGWEAKGASPPGVTNGASHLGVPCASVTFDQTMPTNHSQCRADMAPGSPIPALADTQFCGSGWFSLSRALTGTERLRLIFTSGGQTPVAVVIDAGNSAALVGQWLRRDHAGVLAVNANLFPSAFIHGALASPVTLYVRNLQLEAGDCPTSYIPTAGATVTRAADVAQVPLGAWWQGAAAGTLLVDFECPPVVQSAIAACFNSTGVSNSIGIAKSNAANTAVGSYLVGSMHDGASALSAALDLGAAPGPHRAVLTWGGGTMRAAANGTLGAQVAQRNPVPTNLWLGQRDGGDTPLNGWLRRVSYWPRRMTDGELVAAVS